MCDGTPIEPIKQWKAKWFEVGFYSDREIWWHLMSKQLFFKSWYYWTLWSPFLKNNSRLVAKKSTALQWPKFFLVKGKKGDFMTKLCFELVYSLLCLVFCHHLFKMVLVSLNSKLAVHFFLQKKAKKGPKYNF